MMGGGLQHKLLGTHRIEGYLQQCIAAHRPHGEHQASAEGVVLHRLPCLQLYSDVMDSKK